MTDLPPVSARLDAIQVDAATAGGRVLLELSGIRDLRVTISEAYYREASESELATDLARAIRLLVARRQSAVDEASRSEAEADLVPGSRLAREIAEFNDAVDAFTTEIESSDGRLRLVSMGMREFVVEIEPDTTARVPVEEFVRTAERLGLELIARRIQATSQLRMEYFHRELEERVLRGT